MLGVGDVLEQLVGYLVVALLDRVVQDEGVDVLAVGALGEKLEWSTCH